MKRFVSVAVLGLLSSSVALAEMKVNLLGSVGSHSMRMGDDETDPLEGFDAVGRLQVFVWEYRDILLFAGAGGSYLRVASEKKRRELTRSEVISGFALAIEAGGQLAPFEKLQLQAALGFDKGLSRTSVVRVSGKVHDVSIDADEISDIEAMNNLEVVFRAAYEIVPNTKLGAEFAYNFLGRLTSDEGKSDFSGTAMRLLATYSL